MNDPMTDVVCPKCGNDNLEISFGGDKEYCDGCDKWWLLADLETRAEYLAALEDQGRVDR